MKHLNTYHKVIRHLRSLFNVTCHSILVYIIAFLVALHILATQHQVYPGCDVNMGTCYRYNFNMWTCYYHWCLLNTHLSQVLKSDHNYFCLREHSHWQGLLSCTIIVYIKLIHCWYNYLSTWKELLEGFALKVAGVVRQVQNHRTSNGRGCHSSDVPWQGFFFSFSQGIK